MAWHVFHMAYELLSPLHIGYHKVGNVQRTRYYVPARNIWGAVTERLTRSGFRTTGVPQGDYGLMGTWVREHCAFSYFFIHDGRDLLFPRWTEEGLRYGPFSISEFGRRWVSAHVTTALDASTTSAEEGSLHEVEFISPHWTSDGRIRRTKLYGWVFLDDEGLRELGERWSRWLGEIWVGGERRYGFGRLRLDRKGWGEGTGTPSGYTFHLDGGRPRVTVGRSKPVLAHTLTEGVRGKGWIEPFVGRETEPSGSHSFGRKLTGGRICWTPGTVLQDSACFEVTPEGLWRMV